MKKIKISLLKTYLTKLTNTQLLIMEIMVFSHYEAIAEFIKSCYLKNTKNLLDEENKQYLWNIEKNNDELRYRNNQYLWNMQKNNKKLLKKYINYQNLLNNGNKITTTDLSRCLDEIKLDDTELFGIFTNTENLEENRKKLKNFFSVISISKMFNHHSMLYRKKLGSLRNVLIVLAIVASRHNATASYIGDTNLGLENFKIQNGGYEDNCLSKSRAYSGSGCTRTAEQIDASVLAVHAAWEGLSSSYININEYVKFAGPWFGFPNGIEM